MVGFQHCGLFFETTHIDQARKNANHEPFSTAFADLNSRQARGLAAAQLDGLRYRFTLNEAAADRARHALTTFVSVGLDVNRPALEQITEAVMVAQIFEMVRDKIDAAARTQFVDDWLALAAELIASIRADAYVEHLWLGLLRLVAGIVAENAESVEQGADVFRQTIAEDISPRGHIDLAVAGEDGGSMKRTLLAVNALVLMAEAAAHVGVDLWTYEVRGVSIMTAALYPIYYFYVTDKWQWDDLTPVQVQAAFRRHGGYLEIVNHHAQPRDFKPLLEDLRPIYDPWAGALTTLTHGVPMRRGLFG
ncbi:MAG: alginate lyase family protein [Anaerolineae bacterium]|nr:alginate lyase family protein [Anaerolineae bacterium]